MPDATGYRSKFATIIPSTNTTVEHDFHLIAPHGITFPVGRMYIERPQTRSDAEFEDIIAQVDQGLEQAVRVVATAEPDYMVLGMSAPTFWSGAEGNRRFERRIRELSGLSGVTTGPSALLEGLKLLNARTIGFITPYQPVGDDRVEKFLEETGFTVKKRVGLKIQSITDIGKVSPKELIQALREVDGPGVDVLVQVGTNLSMVQLAAEAERWLGKPVITINSTILWHALRANGFDDQFQSYGTLLREF